MVLCLVPGLFLGLRLVVRVKSNPMHTTCDAAMPPALAESGPLSLVAAALLMVALLAALYHGVAVKLVTDWYELPDFSHGFLIPFFAAFLLWDNRRELQSTEIAPSWAGAWLVVLGLFVLLLGIFGADLFLQRTSFVLLLAGLVWTLLGRAMLGRVKFVLFVLLLAIPLPTILFNQITFPLQIMASRLATALLQLAQVPVLREGNVIQLPAMQLEVAEACSGIRSLMSLFTVAVIFWSARLGGAWCWRWPAFPLRWRPMGLASSAPGCACNTGTRRRRWASSTSSPAG
jgi:exosortase